MEGDRGRGKRWKVYKTKRKKGSERRRKYRGMNSGRQKNTDRRDRERGEWRGRTADYVITSERQGRGKEREMRWWVTIG